MAGRFDVDLDIHLHEPGELGAFSVELILERTAALAMQGRVTISHAFCLGGVDDATLERLIEGLLACDVAIMSLGSGRSVFPPLARLHRAGVRLCTGSDGVRDSWGPYNGVDMLERAMLLGYRSGFRNDEQIEMLVEVATSGGAQVMGAERYGVMPGCRADLVLLPGDTLAHAVIERPTRSLVLNGGRIVAEGGALASDVP
jgi:cytosine/adenosine deaminase-related metal-dependent hydrolase